MSEQNDVEAVKLVDPEVPADQGLSSLGLLMQLSGSVLAAYAALVTLSMLIMPGMASTKGYLLLIIAACIARSLVHRAAGTELLYGKPGFEENPTHKPYGGLDRYVIVGLIQSLFVSGILVAKFGVPTKLGVGLGLGLAAWPATLAVLVDKGFEGASILMTVLGTCGVLGGGAFVLLLLEDKSNALAGAGAIILISAVTMVIRSVLHVQAGIAGLRETSIDRSVELASRYANFGVISAFCVAGALVLMAMMSGFHIMIMVVVVCLTWMLMAWPMIIRKFFGDRQFSDLLAGDAAAIHRRSPDAGLTGLGWLLFANAMLGVTMTIPSLVASGGDANQVLELFSAMGSVGTRSMWFGVGVTVLQGWAGYELIRMGPGHRIIATAYAVIASGVAVYTMWPLVEQLKHMSMGRGGMGGVAVLVPMAIQLVIPVATLLLVNRKLAPTARALVRTPAGSTPA